MKGSYEVLFVNSIIQLRYMKTWYYIR